MKTPNLLIQLNEIRFHLRVVFQSLKTAQLSLDEAREVVSRVELKKEPRLRLVVNNDGH